MNGLKPYLLLPQFNFLPKLFASWNQLALAITSQNLVPGPRTACIRIKWVYFNFLIFFKFILLIFERERENGRGRERGRERESSRLCTVSVKLDVGLEPTNHEILT